MITKYARRALVGLVAAAALSLAPAWAQSQPAAPAGPISAAEAKKAGEAFANQIKPQTPGQIVNPQGVSPKAWGTGSTSLPTAVPQGMGTFSQPITDGSALQSAKTLGLAGLGMKAQLDCANHVSTGDVAKDQACAAINFLSSRCIQPSSAQGQILGSAGQSASGLPTNCEGTYGAGQAKFGFKEGLTDKDSIFAAFGAAVKTQAAQGSTDTTCYNETTPTGPASATTHTCTVCKSATEESCSQILHVTVTTTSNPADKIVDCPPGTTPSGTSCVSTTQDPAAVAYACSQGTLSGSDCLITTSSAATPVYACAAGSTLVDGGKCLTEQNTLVDATVSYVCPAGSTLSGTSCITTSTVPATPLYNCGPDETLRGTECVKIESTPATPVRSCPSPYTLSSNGTDCTVTNVTPASTDLKCPPTIGVLSGTTYCGITYADPRTFGGCPAILDGMSLMTSIGWACVYAWAVQIYVCPATATLVGDKCSTTTTTASNITGYACSNGPTNGTTCITETSRPASVSYSCLAGSVLSGTSCTTTTNQPATPSYSCPAGSVLEGTQCRSSTGQLTPADVSYSCPNGGTLQGTQCVTTTTEPATKTYSCPNGGTLQGDQCITTTSSPATVTYSCADGSAPVGDQCRLRSISQSWVNTCGNLEASAGIVLGKP